MKHVIDNKDKLTPTVLTTFKIALTLLESWTHKNKTVTPIIDNFNRDLNKRGLVCVVLDSPYESLKQPFRGYYCPYQNGNKFI